MRLVIVVLVIVALAAAGYAGKPGDASKRAHDIMKPIVDLHRPTYEGFETTVPPPGWWSIVNNPYTWQVGTYGSIEGSQYADCLYDDTLSGAQNEWIGFERVRGADDDSLMFYAMGSVYWAVTPYRNYNLFVTVEGDTLWDYRNDNDGAITWQWQLYGVDLTAWNVGDTLSIGLGYRGYDGAEGCFDALEFRSASGPQEVCCPLVAPACDSLDFNASDSGIVPAACGGASVWEWGAPVGIPGTACDNVEVTNVLGTILGGDYPSLAGQAAVAGPFSITLECSCLELCHYYDIESGYDGGNVKVSTDGGSTWTIVAPEDGYDDFLDSQTNQAACVWMEEAFTGSSMESVRDCFDLSAYAGQDALVGLFFGSDSSVTEPGWYVKWIKLGSNHDVPVEKASWGAIKALYR